MRVMFLEKNMQLKIKIFAVRLLLWTVLGLCARQTVSGQGNAYIFGKVSDTLGFPVHAADVYVVDNLQQGTSTNESGRYELTIPANKPIIIECSHIGYLTVRDTLTVGAGKRHHLSVVLVPHSISLPNFKISERYTFSHGIEYINSRHIQHIPGVNSGVESLIKSSGLGVSSSNELSSQYNVRGGNYDENLVYLNGIEVYRPFLIRSGQQEGLSFINPDLVHSVKFSSGGFDAFYGDKMSSVLDVQYKIPQKWAGSIAGSLVGATGHLEGTSKNRKLSLLLGVRYQSNSYLFNKLETKGTYNPNFTDIQFLFNYRLSENVDMSFFGNYTRNTYRLVPKSETKVLGTLSTPLGFKVYFDGQEVDAYQTLFAAWVNRFKLNANNALRLNLAYFNSIEKETFDIQGEYFMGEVNTDFDSKDYGQIINSRSVGRDNYHARNFLYSHIFHAQLQGEHQISRNMLAWGIKLQGEFISDELNEWRLYDSTGFSLPFIPVFPGDSVPFEHPARVIAMGDNYLLAANSMESIRFSAFVQDKWEFGGKSHRFFLTGGIRMGFWSFNREFIFSPRLRLTYQPEKLQHFSFYVATGLYAQPPFYKETRKPDGTLNDHIKSQKSYHVIAGTDYLFKIKQRPFKISAEVYYKHLYDLITYSVDNVRIIYTGENNSHGYAVGIDAKLSGEIVHGLESWFSMSLMQSKEKITGQDTFTFRPTDQRFSFNLFFQDRIPKLPMLKAHLNIVFSTGLPFCPPNQHIYSRRGNPYFRTDIGFSWQFIDGITRIGRKNPFKFIKSAYLTGEITNLFNYGNILGYTWINDWKGAYYAVPNYLMPRIFNVKLRFEF
jgi:hypothetical protein